MDTPKPMAHERDEDCTLDANDVCIRCGLYHGDPCPLCEGRGFHKPGCEVVEP